MPRRPGGRDTASRAAPWPRLTAIKPAHASPAGVCEEVRPAEVDVRLWLAAGPAGKVEPRHLSSGALGPPRSLHLPGPQGPGARPSAEVGRQATEKFWKAIVFQSDDRDLRLRPGRGRVHRREARTSSARRRAETLSSPHLRPGELRAPVPGRAQPPSWAPRTARGRSTPTTSTCTCLARLCLDQPLRCRALRSAAWTNQSQ